jgi:RNA polymerase sigma-70 factor (ECF subfamily)
VRQGSESDEDLARRARDGDDAAAGALFDRHRETLTSRVRRKLPRELRRKVAESDVVQEAWLAAFQRLADFEDRGEGSFAAWLGTVVERKVLDEVRRHLGTEKRDARREVDVASGIARIAGATGQTSPATRMIRAEEKDALARAVSALPRAQREVIGLVCGEGLDFETTAERLGKSSSAVRKLYGRAVLALSTRVEGAPGA